MVKIALLAVKISSALIKEITSNHKGDFYCLICLHLHRTDHYNVCKNHDYCYVKMSKEDNKMLKYNHGEIFMKVSFIIYADMESLLEKMSTCHNNPKTSSTTKINNHLQKKHLLVTHCLHIVHLMQQKVSLVYIEVKTVWKGFIRI